MKPKSTKTETKRNVQKATFICKKCPEIMPQIVQE
nr:MAG TPA: MCM OB domain [Caudoviricetes sp.]DAR83999.1 MAG TPA: MCM OB domain [Caudoviricetes sp.]